MNKPIIKVENLSKLYRLGLKKKQAETLAGQIGNLIKSPWRNLKRLREMSGFDIEDESVFWALKDVNFEVKEGEVLGIIGKNGAGKSTLLKILSGITDPSEGKIEIHGRVASLLEVGTGFHPELSGRENIYMNGTILGMTRREIDSKLDEIIDFSGVEKFIDTPVKFYSSGMKVRLGFSVAAHLDPEILIIDEVLAVGDYEFQKKCLGKMEDVSKNQGRTVLFVSHNLEAVKKLCSKAILLKNGKIPIIDFTQKVINYYLKESKVHSNEIEWIENNRPGNEWVKVNSIFASSNSLTEIGVFDRKDEIEIEINFELLKEEIPLNLTLRLLSETGEIVLSTSTQIPVPLLYSGNYSSKCKIPGGLLNDNFYKISILFVRDTSILLFTLNDVISFELFDMELKSTNWHGKIPGLIRPKLDFRINV